MLLGSFGVVNIGVDVYVVVGIVVGVVVIVVVVVREVDLGEEFFDLVEIFVDFGVVEGGEVVECE